MGECPDIELKHTDIEPPIRWEQIFGNTFPLEVEIGFGKCGFLIDIATQNPLINFVGIESSRKYYRKGIKKIQRAEIHNVKLLWGEAFHLFNRYVSDHSVANIYINFPDPWPKNRHAKRRLLKPEFISLAAQKLDHAGCIDLATDVESYMQETREVFQASNSYEMLFYRTGKYPGEHRQYLSDYEKMFLHEGKPIYYAKFRKK